MLLRAAMTHRNEGTPQRHGVLETKKNLTNHKLISGTQQSKNSNKEEKQQQAAKAKGGLQRKRRKRRQKLARNGCSLIF